MLRIVLICFVFGYSLGEPVVDGSLGKITGIVEQVLDTHIESFLGIPYAKPPLRKLRFELPQAFGPVGELRATEFSPPCSQVPDPSTPLGDKPPSEDCLYLNVFRKQGTSKSDKKAVRAREHFYHSAPNHRLIRDFQGERLLSRLCDETPFPRRSWPSSMEEGTLSEEPQPLSRTQHRWPASET